MEFDAVFTVKKEIEKEAFLRQLLINLGNNAETPVDVVKAEIGEVQESIREVIVCTATVTGTCTASIGYDRQEPYTDYETYKEKVGDSYVTRQRAVTKYRTVTDWRPFNMDYSGEATCAEDNTDDCISYTKGDITLALKTASEDSFVVKGDATISQKGLARAIRSCETTVEIREVDFPGDRHKDQRYHSTSNVERVSCYKLPFYEVTFTYEGKEYTASGFACGSLVVHNDVPKKNVDIEAEAKKMTEKFEKSSKTAWLSCFGALAISALACFVLKFCWLWPVAIAALVYACITNKKYHSEYKKSADMLSSDLATAKIDALKEALDKYGYKELGDAEVSKTEIASKTSPKPPKSFTGKAVLCAILSVVVMISSFVTNNKNLHSPEQVKINIVNKEVEYDPDARPYVNGCYYIYLDFEVEAKKTGVEYVELKVYISDKSGNELGFVRASLSDLNVEAGDEKIITLNLSENQPEKNEFFSELYDADFSELKFKYEIGSIRFIDGEYYNNDDYNEFG